MYCSAMLAGAVLFVIPATAQEQEAVEASSKVKTTPPGSEKPALLNATRVSTDAAIRGAAKKAIKQAGGDKTSQPEGTDVLEFRPAESESTTSSSSVVTQKTIQKGPLKGLHGTVYGVTDANNPRTNAEGAAVGVSSKSGNSAIFVETDRARTSPPH
jgi:hypothetical protein